MTDHRALQIIDAVAGLVRARVEAGGTKVFTHRRYSLAGDQDELPAISVDFGEDQRADSVFIGAIDSVLAVQVTAVSQDPDEKALRLKLMELRTESHRAVMADQRLGIGSVVVTTFYGGASAPDIGTDGEQHVGELTSTWLVRYRMAPTDPAT